MNGQVRDRLIHALLALMLSVGLLMPLLGILDPSLMSTDVLLWVAGLIIVLELLSLRSCFCGVGNDRPVCMAGFNESDRLYRRCISCCFTPVYGN